MGNIGDLAKDGNTSYDQGGTHNMDQRWKLGTTNMNYCNTPSCLTNTGISTGTMTTWNEMAERKLNSSQDACLNEGVMSQFISFFPFYLPNCDSGPVGPLIDTSTWHSHVITLTLRILTLISHALLHTLTCNLQHATYTYIFTSSI